MKLKTLIIIAVLSVGYSLSSKTYAQFSLGAELGLPMGNFSDIANAGFGASVRYEASINGKLNWTGAIGYLSFSGKNFTSGNVTIPFGNSTIVPLTGGIKYYLSETRATLHDLTAAATNDKRKFILTNKYTDAFKKAISKCHSTNKRRLRKEFYIM